MATAFHSPTPPASSTPRTPPTPRYGFDDNYQPYSPRKSARVSKRSQEAKTPPPATSLHSVRKSHSTPRVSKRAASSSMKTSPSSPQTASKKRGPKSSPNIGGRRVSGALTYDTTASAAAALGLPAPKSEPKQVQSTTATIRTGMLPTPAKTPKHHQNVAAPVIASVARNLFPLRSGSDEEVMPSPKKGKKRYKGFTLDSFEAQEDDTPIQIYTDSHDRVPEVDAGLNNPFYGEGASVLPEPIKRSSKRRKISVPGEGEQTIEELERRDDGLVYVFRGKKVFRKFEDFDETGSVNGEGDESELDEEAPPELRRPMTRSSIKPRLLFPTPQQIAAKAHNTEDEEADTDIEEPMDSISTPTAEVHKAVDTPQPPKFAPVTPPTTSRATRSKKVELSSSPAGVTSSDESPSTSTKRSIRGGSPYSNFTRHRRPAKRSGDTLTQRSGVKKSRG